MRLCEPGNYYMHIGANGWRPYRRLLGLSGILALQKYDWQHLSEKSEREDLR
jgi:hypothetical protein